MVQTDSKVCSQMWDCLNIGEKISKLNLLIDFIWINTVSITLVNDTFTLGLGFNPSRLLWLYEWSFIEQTRIKKGWKNMKIDLFDIILSKGYKMKRNSSFIKLGQIQYWVIFSLKFDMWKRFLTWFWYFVREESHDFWLKLSVLKGLHDVTHIY